MVHVVPFIIVWSMSPDLSAKNRHLCRQPSRRGGEAGRTDYSPARTATQAETLESITCSVGGARAQILVGFTHREALTLKYRSTRNRAQPGFESRWAGKGGGGVAR